MKGMTLRAMTQAVNGIYHGNGEDYDKEITAITIDSRKVAAVSYTHLTLPTNREV